RYVRPELALSMQQLSDIATTHTRMLQRYQNQSTSQLKDILTERETRVRLHHNKQRLRSMIPEELVSLVGRDDSFNRILNIIAEDVSLPIVVSGVHGIGKSAIIAQVTNTLIDEDWIDTLVWIKSPSSIQQIINQIWNELAPQSSSFNLQELLLYNRFLLVIDDVSLLDTQSEQWTNLTTQLREAVLMCTITNIEKLWLPIHHISLEALSVNSSLELIKKYTGSQALPDSELLTDGGNPQHIVSATLRKIRSGDSWAKVFEELYQQQIDNLTLEQRVNLLLQYIGEPSSQIKSQLGLVDDTHIGVTKNMYQQLLAQESVRDDIKLRLIRLIEQSTLNEELWQLVYNLLSRIDWDDREFLSHCLHWLYQDNLSYARIQQWRYVFDRVFTLNADMPNDYLRLKYGIVLRRSIQYDEASTLFETLIADAGQRGDFQLQSETLYEMAVLKQAQTQYKMANDLYQRVLASAQRSNDQNLIDAVLLQQARIAIAPSWRAMAIQLLQDRHSEHDAIAFIIYCEAKLLIGDWDFLDTAIPNFLQTPHLDTRQKSTLYTTLGRTHQSQSLYESAIVHFNEALTLAERTQNRFDIARARTNFCVASTEVSKNRDKQYIDELLSVLRDTLTMQSQIEDAIGQEATTRNIRYLERLRLSL
ncbi:MAG: NB-ARC domain-containing protein, partial [Chloroflexota bacterium]